MSNVRKLYPETKIENSALVLRTEGGEAREILLPGANSPTSVSNHLSHVPALQEGDRVHFVLEEVGATITGRVRPKGEEPPPLLRQEDGCIVVESAGGVCLKCGESRIEIRPDGYIEIDGQEVCTTAGERLRLRGGTILVG